MSAIGVGALLALVGVILFGAHEPVGIISFILGAVCAFSGMASQQEQKRLKSVDLKRLAPPTPALPDRAHREAEDAARAEAVWNSPSLPVLPVSIPLEPGEYACYRAPANLTDGRQTRSLAGRNMAWESFASQTDDGELYVTTQRVVFSGTRTSRELPLSDVSGLRTGAGAVEITRREWPRPVLLGVGFPLETAAYIERARQERVPTSALRLQSLPSPWQETPPWQEPDLARTLTRADSAASVAPAVPGMVKCEQCGAANGLSANFCQNCAAPIARGSTPTLSHPNSGG